MLTAQALSASPEIHWSNVDTAPCGDGISVAEALRKWWVSP